MSQQSISLLSLPVLAAGTLAAHRFVTPLGAYAAAGEPALGVTRSEASQGDLVPVDAIGTAVVEAGEAIPAGSYIEVGANGVAMVLDEGVPVALTAPGASAGDDGDHLEVFLLPGGPAPDGGEG